MSSAPVAIITGAGSGIGRAVAQALAAEGYAVVLVGRREEPLRETAESINQSQADPATLVHPADITDPDQVDRLVETTTQQFGRIDALINVAGFATLVRLDGLDPKVWRSTIDVNLSGPVYLTRACWPKLCEADQPIAVNISSMASRDPFAGLGPYGVAKAGLNMLTFVTAREGEKAGLRAVAIAPGAVETSMLRNMFNQKQLPPDQALAPEQVAELVADCVTGRRSFTSGETLFINR
jgi:NAD(P)-dependent dehydrogenase (short-subunit alcohol dehydrogenase family)